MFLKCAFTCRAGRTQGSDLHSTYLSSSHQQFIIGGMETKYCRGVVVIFVTSMVNLSFMLLIDLPRYFIILHWWQGYLLFCWGPWSVFSGHCFRDIPSVPELWLQCWWMFYIQSAIQFAINQYKMVHEKQKKSPKLYTMPERWPRRNKRVQFIYCNNKCILMTAT